MDTQTAKKMIKAIKRIQELQVINNRKPHDVDISSDFLFEKFEEQNGLCHWSGLPLNTEYNSIGYHPFGISMERLNTNKGYEADNVVLTRRLFNLGKNRFDSEQFPEVMNQLRKEFLWQIYSKM